MFAGGRYAESGISGQTQGGYGRPTVRRFQFPTVLLVFVLRPVGRDRFAFAVYLSPAKQPPCRAGSGVALQFLTGIAPAQRRATARSVGFNFADGGLHSPAAAKRCAAATPETARRNRASWAGLCRNRSRSVVEQFSTSLPRSRGKTSHLRYGAGTLLPDRGCVVLRRRGAAAPRPVQEHRPNRGAQRL